MNGYFHSPASSYLTLPERYVVSSAEEYASFVKSRAPSRFPYFAAVGQYWRYYKGACRVTKRVYPFDAGAHVKLGIIAPSFSMENAVKGGYENTVGVVAEGIGFYHTDEDIFARKTARSTRSSCARRPGTTSRSVESSRACGRKRPCAPVSSLHTILTELSRGGVGVEHVHAY